MLNSSLLKAILLTGMFSVFTLNTFAQAAGGGVVSPVQSNADPYGLRIAGPVMEAGSTAASAMPGIPADIRFSRL